MTFNDMVFVKEKNHVTARARIQYHIRGYDSSALFLRRSQSLAIAYIPPFP